MLPACPQKIAGKSFGSSIQRTKLDPLDPAYEKSAKTHRTFDNRNIWPVARPIIKNGTTMGSAGRAKSCVNNLLYSDYFLAAAKCQLENHCTSTSHSHLRQVSNMVRSKILTSSSNPPSGSHALGSVVTEPPSTGGIKSQFERARPRHAYHRTINERKKPRMVSEW